MSKKRLTYTNVPPALLRFTKRSWVTRPLYMDDGTWAKLGDACLKLSPLRRGRVAVPAHDGCLAVEVDWYHEGRESSLLNYGIYLEHGIKLESEVWKFE